MRILQESGGDKHKAFGMTLEALLELFPHLPGTSHLTIGKS